MWSDVKVPKMPAEIGDLKEDVSYIFKVAKVHDGTIGEFSDQSQPIKVTLSLKPTIIKALHDIVVPKKDEFKLECFAIGESPLLFVWYKDEREISLDDSNISVSFDCHIKLKFQLYCREAKDTCGIFGLLV